MKKDINSTPKSMFRRIVLGIGIFFGIVILAVGAFLGILSIAEYRPKDVENLEIRPGQTAVSALPRPATGTPFSVLSWNIGYASLDETQDFFMDGGKGIRPATDENVKRNLAGIRDFITRNNSDIVMIQEADVASRRSYYVDQTAYLAEGFSGSSVFAYNFQSLIVPIPFPEIIGRVSSGLLVMNRFQTTQAARMSLPNPFSWPIRIANLKRCLLVSRIPLENSNAQLVLVNLHLEAYDSSGGREAQTKMLLDFLSEEYAKGNYCIAGGDFNQNFPGIDERRFAVKNSEYFVAGTLSPGLLAPGWKYAADTQVSSARLLNEPYSGNQDDTQLYVIDGFILSPNVELLSVQTFNMEFKYSDHNPVTIRVVLK